MKKKQHLGTLEDTKIFLDNERNVLLKHIEILEKQIEQVTIQAKNEINQRQQTIIDAKSKIVQIEKALNGCLTFSNEKINI